jgi:hypothetical protein
MQATTNVIERRVIGRQRIGLFIDVFEGDVAGADGGQQLVALPVNPGVANGAARVVPDNKAMERRTTLERVLPEHLSIWNHLPRGSKAQIKHFNAG